MNGDDGEIGTWLKIFVVCIFGLGSVMGFFLFFSRNSLLSKASGEQASLLFIPHTQVVQKGNTVKVQILLDTNKAYVRGVDVAVAFDQSFLTLNSIIPKAQKDSQLRTYLPLDYSNDFDSMKVISQANKNGRMEFSAITADMKKNQLMKSINGNLVLAELEFLMKKEGTTKVTILKSHPSRDSTVVQATNPPINILTKTNVLTLTTLIPTLSP